VAYDPNDPADKKIVKDLIAAALAEAETEHAADIAGLKKKNTELIAEKRELQSGVAKAKPEELAALETQIDDLQGKLKQSEKDHKAAVKKIEETNTELTGERNYASDLLVESNLTSALSEVKVATPFMDAVKAMIKPKATIKVENGVRSVLVGDKSLSDHVKEWSQGDQGKAFISANINSGNNAPGSRLPGNQNQAAKQMSRADYETMQATNPGSVAAFFKEGGTLLDA
jgi:hypothetical protein